MSKALNVILVFLLLPLFVIAIIAGFDLNAFGLFEGVETPYLREVFLVAAGMTAIMLGLRAVQRWLGLRIFHHEDKFLWIGTISKERRSRVRLYLILENSYLLFLGIYFLLISDYSEPLGWVCVAGFVEAIFFIVFRNNARHMKSGVTKQAVIVGDRDVRVYYFSGLRKVSVLQDTIYMEYKDDLTLSFPVSSIDPKDREEFKKHFLDGVNANRVFVSEKFKDL